MSALVGRLEERKKGLSSCISVAVSEFVSRVLKVK